MYLEQRQEECVHVRTSKLGNLHVYSRLRTWVYFRCDSCGSTFQRLKEKVSPKRLSNNYFHCCPNCDSKRFAQKKGAERRTIWDMTVNSNLDISRL
jgi:Zn finger protein HypA/HybF involved in hydrogenase expression